MLSSSQIVSYACTTDSRRHETARSRYSPSAPLVLCDVCCVRAGGVCAVPTPFSANWRLRTGSRHPSPKFRGCASNLDPPLRLHLATHNAQHAPCIDAAKLLAIRGPDAMHVQKKSPFSNLPRPASPPRHSEPWRGSVLCNTTKAAEQGPCLCRCAADLQLASGVPHPCKFQALCTSYICEPFRVQRLCDKQSARRSVHCSRRSESWRVRGTRDEHTLN